MALHITLVLVLATLRACHARLLLFWAVDSSRRTQDLVKKNVDHVKASGLGADVVLAHYEGSSSDWGREWYRRNVRHSVTGRGYKFHFLQELFKGDGKEWPDKYEYIWALDSDIDISGADLQRLLEIARATGSKIVGPTFMRGNTASLMENSGVRIAIGKDGQQEELWNEPNKLQIPNSGCDYRYADFVELTAPLVRTDALDTLLVQCQNCIGQKSDWGLDLMWCNWLSEKMGKNACALVDKTPVAHLDWMLAKVNNDFSSTLAEVKANYGKYIAKRITLACLHQETGSSANSSPTDMALPPPLTKVQNTSSMFNTKVESTVNESAVVTAKVASTAKKSAVATVPSSRKAVEKTGATPSPAAKATPPPAAKATSSHAAKATPSPAARATPSPAAKAPTFFVTSYDSAGRQKTASPKVNPNPRKVAAPAGKVKTVPSTTQKTMLRREDAPQSRKLNLTSQKAPLAQPHPVSENVHHMLAQVEKMLTEEVANLHSLEKAVNGKSKSQAAFHHMTKTTSDKARARRKNVGTSSLLQSGTAQATQMKEESKMQARINALEAQMAKDHKAAQATIQDQQKKLKDLEAQLDRENRADRFDELKASLQAEQQESLHLQGKVEVLEAQLRTALAAQR